MTDHAPSTDQLLAEIHALRALLGRRDSGPAPADSGGCARRPEDACRVGFWECDLRTLKVAWSEDTFHLYGLPPAEGPPDVEVFLRCHSEGTVFAAQVLIERAISEGTPFDLEYEVMTPRGRKLLAAHGEPRFDEAGTVVGLAGTILDVTDEKQQEEARWREQQFLQAVLEQVQPGIIACDAEGHLTLLNRAARDLHGLPPISPPRRPGTGPTTSSWPTNRLPCRPTRTPSPAPSGAIRCGRWSWW